MPWTKVPDDLNKSLLYILRNARMLFCIPSLYMDNFLFQTHNFSLGHVTTACKLLFYSFQRKKTYVWSLINKYCHIWQYLGGHGYVADVWKGDNKTLCLYCVFSLTGLGLHSKPEYFTFSHALSYLVSALKSMYLFQQMINQTNIFLELVSKLCI